MMLDIVYQCRACQQVFRVARPAACSLDGSHAGPPEVKCPGCGSADAKEIPWAPLEFNENPNTWQYQCQQCRHIFERPIPSSPSAEKEMTCPECRAADIRRLTAIRGEPLYCG